ncbi:hypothetical protein [Taibaiella koreensis]|uniref:hypothetical protein n=1 Tax=Taibaiella koreensis TaxID=1268548 RepID=UPI000E59D8C0|nr:hypothetical protein [Taibaiella koreensis]
MTQRFTLKVDEMRQNEPTAAGYEPEAGPRDDDIYYPSYGNVRHICFGWPDGRKLFLNYAYLISGEYIAEEDKVTLLFTTHGATLTGINLSAVFNKIMGQQVRLLQCVDSRYNAIEPDRPIVNSIDVSLNS